MKIVVMDDDGHIVTLPSAQEVPSWLKKNRADSKMSMQEVGDQLGVTKQAVYSWESGIAVPTAENLAKLVGVFDEVEEKAAPVAAAPVKKRSKMDAIDDLLKPHARNVS
jgi:transcriptional regulator with XRE-family HTH domain